MCKSPQYSVSPPQKQCRCEKWHGPFRKRHEISVLTTCKDTHIYKSNVLRCFSECHPHHGSYGMVSDKLDFDFCLELFDTYSGKDYFFTEGGNGSVWQLTTSEKDLLGLKQQHVGRSVHEQPKLVGRKIRTWHPVCPKPVLEFFESFMRSFT